MFTYWSQHLCALVCHTSNMNGFQKCGLSGILYVADCWAYVCIPSINTHWAAPCSIDIVKSSTSVFHSLMLAFSQHVCNASWWWLGVWWLDWGAYIYMGPIWCMWVWSIITIVRLILITSGLRFYWATLLGNSAETTGLLSIYWWQRNFQRMGFGYVRLSGS